MLEPMNLHDPSQFDELRAQRLLCGWNHADAVLLDWRDMMDAGQKSFFWITHPSTGARVGHISLDSHAYPEDLELANPDKSVLTIATFFIAPEFRSLGLGRRAMDLLEEWATREPYGSPDCRVIAVNTLSGRYYTDDGEEWRGIFKKRLGSAPPPRERDNEAWYARRGYVKWKEQPKYARETVDGEVIKLVAVYLLLPNISRFCNEPLQIYKTMVKALAFKGDKKPKKRKRPATDADLASDDDASAPSSKALTNVSSAAPAAPPGADDDDSWVTADAVGDVAGPVVFILPTSPVTCLASDANGKVFASGIENIVEGDAATAEPHDVRQVWVANRVAGTEGFSFKGHHGRYMGCDRVGVLSATKEAISPEESWGVVAAPDSPGMLVLQTQRGGFLTVEEGRDAAIRGDAETIGFNTTLRIRMQARFKPRLKASKEEKAREKISRKELEDAVGRRLEDDEVKKLKRARREGNYHEALLDVKVKGKHDKFA